MIQMIDRRSLLKSSLAIGAGLATSSLARPALAQSKEMTLAVWGSDAEVAAYNAVIAKYQAANPGTTIRLDVMPFAQFYQQVDTRLAGRQAPDLFRVTYQQVGRYATGKAAIDLTPYLEANTGDAFTSAVWSAVSVDGAPFALPHHTDTFALYYNADALDGAGIALPTSMEDAWTWAKFVENAKLLKERQAGNYPFAMSWQNGAVHRWLIYLYQHGGKLLNDDLSASAIQEPEGIETIRWTQSWFQEGLVPPSTSLKSSERIQNLFVNGTIPMMLNGNWQIPFVQQQASRFKWGVTYLPRDKAMADDLGGTCVAVSRDAKDPAAAAAFLRFLTDEANMRDFVNEAQFLPVRRNLVESGIDYKLRPDEMRVFTEMTRTIPEHLVRTVTLPTWGRFNPRFADQLDLAFTSGQSPEETAETIAADVDRILVA